MAANHDVTGRVMSLVQEQLEKTVAEADRLDTIVELYHRIWGELKRQATARHVRSLDAFTDPAELPAPLPSPGFSAPEAKPR